MEGAHHGLRQASRPQHAAARPWRSRWPWLVLAAVIAVQSAQIGLQSVGRPGFGTDFQLLYAAAAAWAQRLDPYDDAVIKETWRTQGDPTLPEPGRPITPNVYPLTIAPLVWPLTCLPFGAAILLWTAVVLAAEAYLLMWILRAACPDRSPRPDPEGSPDLRPNTRPIAVAVAVVIFMLCYPVRLNLASLNLGMVTAALALAAVKNDRRFFVAGIAMGLSLVKYSVTGPLLLWMAWRRQYRAVGVAIAVQAVLVLTATWAGGYRHPLEWVGAMRAEISHSLTPGEINAHDALQGAAMHLHVRSLWHRFLPDADPWHWLLVAGLLALTVVALCVAPARRRSPPRQHETDLQVALVLSTALVSFYHRAYDLIPVMVLVLAWLVRPRLEVVRRRPADAETTRRPSTIEIALWVLLALTIVPGLWRGWDAANAPAWMRLWIQPACAWTALLSIPLLCFVVRRYTATDDARES